VPVCHHRVVTDVPIVDISNLSTASLEAVDAACRSHGFFLLEGHDLDELIERVWQETQRFFDADPAVRDAIRRSADEPFGYNDRELTKRKRDHKQVLDFGDPSSERVEERNAWPDDLPGFRDVMAEFYKAFGELMHRAVGVIHDALALSPDGCEQMRADPSLSSMRLNHYLSDDPVPEMERLGLAALGPTALGYHTDPGVITLLLQDGTGGLQTRTRDGDWIDVPPRAGTVVVNLGDTMQVWTNDRYVAAVHRVAALDEGRRFSIPLFCNPTWGAVVEPLPELVDDTPRYRPFVWLEFIKARTDDNFADAGTDDAQISDYAIG